MAVSMAAAAACFLHAHTRHVLAPNALRGNAERDNSSRCRYRYFVSCTLLPVCCLLLAACSFASIQRLFRTLDAADATGCCYMDAHTRHVLATNALRGNAERDNSSRCSIDISSMYYVVLTCSRSRIAWSVGQVSRSQGNPAPQRRWLLEGRVDACVLARLIRPEAWFGRRCARTSWLLACSSLCASVKNALLAVCRSHDPKKQACSRG